MRLEGTPRRSRRGNLGLKDLGRLTWSKLPVVHEKVEADMTNQWDAAQYDAKHAFVYEKAKGLVELLAPKAAERILDLGCGTGTLTAEIAGRGAHTLGVDQSEEMIYTTSTKSHPRSRRRSKLQFGMKLPETKAERKAGH